MAQARAGSGLVVSWGATHRHNGKLVVRLVSIDPPKAIECLRFSCLWNYLIASLSYTLVLLYHKRRVAYAESHRDKDILERYRTGEPSPQTLWQAIHAHIKLTCPICRKYNVDPFLK